jgi:hypothetical protein
MFQEKILTLHAINEKRRLTINDPSIYLKKLRDLSQIKQMIKKCKNKRGWVANRTKFSAKDVVITRIKFWQV